MINNLIEFSYVEINRPHVVDSDKTTCTKKISIAKKTLMPLLDTKKEKNHF